MPTPAPAPTASGFGTRQEVTPRVILLTRHLCIDEPVDGLVGDDLFAVLPGEPAGDLLWGPALLET